MLKKKETSWRESANDRTLEEPPLPDEIGENTEKLSDVSKNENDEMLYSAHHATTWTQRLTPLMRNPCVRAYFITNLTIFMMNLFILVCVSVLLGTAVYHKIRSTITRSHDLPCLYKWTYWGPCSADCYIGVGPPPNMSRTVDKRTIVQARGKFMDTLPCPTNLAELVDYAPCNSHICPRRLSEFSFVGPFISKYDPSENDNNQCYYIRNITRGNYMVYIDTTDLVRTTKCSKYLESLKIL